MKFITNCSEHDTNKTIAELTVGHPGRQLRVGEAHVANTPGAWDADELKRHHVVGIYELEPGE
jgi:hypothetical protein